MAAIDIAGFVADLKDHAVDHRFHVHDERHFVETYSLRQAWEVDLHPEEACGGPLDLHLALEVDPRALLALRGRDRRPPRGRGAQRRAHFPLVFTGRSRRCRRAPICWCWPPSWPASAVPTSRSRCRPSTATPTSPTRPQRTLTIVARVEISLAKVFTGQEALCDIYDRCYDVSQYLLDHARSARQLTLGKCDEQREPVPVLQRA